jgi:integrase/recombinase XerD
VNLWQREITVRGKGGKVRVVKITHDGALALGRYIRVSARYAQACRRELWLGVNNRGPLTSNGIYQTVARRGYLARFNGSSRYHTQADLRCYVAWCAERGQDPLEARRPHLELYIRWMQEIRRFKPSTVSRRFSVVAGFYKTCVIHGLLEHSPAEHVRRPSVPPESPTLGFTHLQFEALLTTARESSHPCDFALVAMLGLLGLRIFEATGADIADLGEEHGHRVLRVCGKGTEVVLIPLPPAVGWF